MKQNIVRSVELEDYDTIIVPAFEDSDVLPGFSGELEPVKAIVGKARQTGKKEAIGSIAAPVDGRLVNVITVNLGKKEQVKNKTIFQNMSKAYAKCKDIGSESLLVYGGCVQEDEISRDGMRLIFEAGGMADYCFDKYKTEKDDITVRNIDYYKLGSDEEETLREAGYFASGIKLARRLINEPAVYMTPLKLAEEAVNAGRENGFKVSVLDEKAVRELGMNAFLAVGKGSDFRPVLIVMEYEGDKGGKEKLGIAGKGITFDTGGYSMKSPTSMKTMFSDMGGAAALIGAMTSISSMKLKANVVGVIAACENKVSGGSVLPGDIVKSMSGKYIEINNTDAEGRLTLVDAMTYMLRRHKVSRLVTIATLTGAVGSALGKNIAGVFTDDDVMRKATLAASARHNEKTWELPMDEDMRSIIDSDFADIKNSAIGSTAGGFASVAALFLKEFSEEKPFLHIDMAGVNWEECGTAWCPVGGRGYGVKLLYGIVKELEKGN